MLDDCLKRIDVVLVDRFHAEHYIAVHLYETAVAVVGETLVAGLLGQTHNHLVVQAEVEDGVHHARHGSTRSGTHADKQRVLSIAEAKTHEILDVANTLLHIVFQQGDNICLAFLKILVANLGSNREAGRNRHTDKIHLGKVGTFTAQQVSHVGTAFCLTVTKGINPFLVHKYSVFIYINV